MVRFGGTPKQTQTLFCQRQELRSLTLLDAAEHAQAFTRTATLTQLTRLDIQGVAPTGAISCLSALTRLQSLSLSLVELAEPGMSLVAKDCRSMCQALPLLHSLTFISRKLPDLAAIPQICPPLRSLVLIQWRDQPSDSWVQNMLQACALQQAAHRPPLTVQLPNLGGPALAAAKQLWAQLSNDKPRISAVIITDANGNALV